MVVDASDTEPSVETVATAAQIRFGECLRQWRARASFTQTRLAATLRYSPALVSRVEAGTRRASVAFARAADSLLGAGGELVELAIQMAVERRDTTSDAVTGVAGDAAIPLPAPAPGNREFDLSAFSLRAARPTGLVCPEHGDVHEGVHDLGLVDEAVRAPRTAGIHALLAFLSLYDRFSLETRHVVDVAALVERMAHAINDRIASGPLGQRRHMMHVAADFAAEAGRMRFEIRQPSAATAWLTRATAWAAASGNTPAHCRALGTMSLIALFEGDPCSAARYAETSCHTGRARPWVLAHGHLWSARAAASGGDRSAFERSVAAVFRAIERFGDQDRAEAPWLTGDEGTTYVHTSLAGSLRDLSARTGDAAIATRGALTARTALDSVPAAMRPTHLLLLIRYADCLARSGDPQAAIELAGPALNAARASTSSMIQRDLASLHAALADVCPDGPRTSEVSMMDTSS
ncbi:helix-turn-helix domain-containing protein [Amycolatopsis pittospori]|uniref:helix-turn-helix domain-containing protein n=1 Tax=Amycolatopsis pittospori TaxID=2749434 RepID=UPI0015F0CB75|nr:helix-turn-helix transcriptional regulator [Amycolatopsis pittospori]